MRLTPPFPDRLMNGIAGFCLCLLIPLFSAVPDIAGAENMKSVGVDARVEINAHGVCRRVHNGAGSPVMIPIRSPEEWTVGRSSFLGNVPTGMTAYACVSPEIGLRRWSRPGPPDSTGQPFLVDGADHGLTFTSVGTSTDGVVPVLLGNQISYTPLPERWLLNDLETVTDRVPFEAIDAEGVPVLGYLNVALVGFGDTKATLSYRYYDPSQEPFEYGDFWEIPSVAKEGVQINMIFQFKTEIFDGQTSFVGLMSVGFRLGHFLVIDNSPASMGPYSGPAVGDVNGDGSSNTILDAQIRAALDFADLMVENRRAEVGTVRISALNDLGSFLQISKFGEGLESEMNPNPKSGTEPIFIYTANATSTFVGQTDDSTYATYLSSARSAILGIRASGSALNAAQVFNTLDGHVSPLIPGFFAMPIHFLSPGVNSGAAPTVSRFNQTGTGQLGTPIFSYFTGGDAGGAPATFMSTIDHAGVRRHMTNPSVFGSNTPPNAVIPMFRMSKMVNGTYELIRMPDGSLLEPTLSSTSVRKLFSFGFRLLPNSDQTCYSLSCQYAGVPTTVVENVPGILSEQGEITRFRLLPIMFMNPIYRAHYDWNADNFNRGGVMFSGGFLIQGGYTPLPPD